MLNDADDYEDMPPTTRVSYMILPLNIVVLPTHGSIQVAKKCHKCGSPTASLHTGLLLPDYYILSLNITSGEHRQKLDVQDANFVGL